MEENIMMAFGYNFNHLFCGSRSIHLRSCKQGLWFKT